MSSINDGEKNALDGMAFRVKRGENKKIAKWRGEGSLNKKADYA